MIIKGGKIFSEEGVFLEGSIEISEGKINKVLWEYSGQDSKGKNIIDTGAMYRCVAYYTKQKKLIYRI